MKESTERKRYWKSIAVNPIPLTCWYQKGKNCYDKRGATSQINHSWKINHTRLRAYWCNKCNFWHTTSRLEIYDPESKGRDEDIQFFGYDSD